MAKQPSEFCRYIADALEPLGEIRIKAMFGGYGVYIGSTIVAIIASDVLYVKVDDLTRPRFEAQSLQRFTFEMKGKMGSMSYYQLPDSAIDDHDELLDWVVLGLEAGKRASTKKARKPKKRRKST